MIPYYGGPHTPETVSWRVWRGRHAFISNAHPAQVGIAASVSQSFALDNGAFSKWKAGTPTDWPAYYAWCEQWLAHPACDWAVIPDVIDGDEQANDDLLNDWPFRNRGVPVWHMHESIGRLERLCGSFERVALGSSGDFATVGDHRWWIRIAEAMNAICDEDGRPDAKLHGLRMLDPDVFTRLPFSSADSTNIAQNIGLDSRWTGAYPPANKETRAIVIAERIEQYNAAATWKPTQWQRGLFPKSPEEETTENAV